jgi:hypothetical protein
MLKRGANVKGVKATVAGKRAKAGGKAVSVSRTITRCG